MRLFICFRSVDEQEGIKVINGLANASDKAVVILKETQKSPVWKKKVTHKFNNADFVVFLLGHNTFDSSHIIWELDKAKSLNKHIIGIKLSDVSYESLLYFKKYPVFNTIEESLNYASLNYQTNKKLLIIQ